MIGGGLPSLWATLALGYLGAGAGLAWHLGRKGHGFGTAASALACWPLLLGLIGRPPPSGERPIAATEPGPNRERIDRCIQTLADGLAETLDAGGSELIDATQLAKLRAALHRADARIAWVDRVLRETQTQCELATRGADARAAETVVDGSLGVAIATLHRAREHAHHEIEAVLACLLQLRVQLGLFTLAGQSEPVRERLAELEARVAALAELSSVELAQVRS